MSSGKGKTISKVLAVYACALVLIVVLLVPICLVIALALSKLYDLVN